MSEFRSISVFFTVHSLWFGRIAKAAVQDEAKVSQPPWDWKALFSGNPVSEKQMLPRTAMGATLEGRHLAISALRPPKPLGSAPIEYPGRSAPCP
jgi:hypothetical protein